jgi:hypothetical protein
MLLVKQFLYECIERRNIFCNIRFINCKKERLANMIEEFEEGDNAK